MKKFVTIAFALFIWVGLNGQVSFNRYYGQNYYSQFNVSVPTKTNVGKVRNEADERAKRAQEVREERERYKLYRREIKKIRPRKDETRLEYTNRKLYEQKKIYHEIYHSELFMERDCEFCRIVALNAEAERKEKARLEEEKRKEEERLKEEERKREEEAKLEAQKENLMLGKRLTDEFFSDEYIMEKSKVIKSRENNIKTIKKALDKLFWDRKKEVDALERQYAGRLEGEIFKDKLFALNYKYDVKTDKFEKDLNAELNFIDDFKSGVERELNSYLRANGYSFSLAPKMATIDGRVIRNGDLYAFRWHNGLDQAISDHIALVWEAQKGIIYYSGVK